MLFGELPLYELPLYELPLYELPLYELPLYEFTLNHIFEFTVWGLNSEFSVFVYIFSSFTSSLFR
jgi:hypothetical protein